MRYSKLLNKFKCDMNRVDSFVVVTLRNGSYASVCRSSLKVNQSLQFAFIHLEISDSVSYNTYLFATFRTSSQTIATIRHGIVLDHLICKLAGHNLITCDIKR